MDSIDCARFHGSTHLKLSDLYHKLRKSTLSCKWHSAPIGKTSCFFDIILNFSAAWRSFLSEPLMWTRSNKHFSGRWSSDVNSVNTELWRNCSFGTTVRLDITGDGYSVGKRSRISSRRCGWQFFAESDSCEGLTHSSCGCIKSPGTRLSPSCLRPPVSFPDYPGH